MSKSVKNFFALAFFSLLVLTFLSLFPRNTFAQNGTVSCRKVDIVPDGAIDNKDFEKLKSCYGSTANAGNWLNCKIADINDDNKVDLLDFSWIATCYGSILPPPNPIKVEGYVKDAVSGKGLAGAKVMIHKTNNALGVCSGQHFGCNPEYAVTDWSGKWTSTCSGSPMNSIFIKETTNSIGYVDSSKSPDFDKYDATAWNINTVCYKYLGVKTSLDSINFYDKK